MRGEYDNELKWPFEGDIRVELLNWRRRQESPLASIIHTSTDTTDPNGTRSTLSCHSSKVTGTGFGNPQFISHTDLAPTTNTEYLLNDDYLKLRVSAGSLLHTSPPPDGIMAGLPHHHPVWGSVYDT